MITAQNKLLLVCGTILWLAGCSLDQVVVIDHPAHATPGQQFDVPIYNQYLYLTNGSTFSSDVIRDSVHLSVGIPNGWSVTSSRYYVARNFDIVALAGRLDSVALAQAIRDSSLVFKSRAAAMTADNSYSAILGNRNYDATEWNTNNTLAINTNSVFSWKSFRGKTDILFNQGDKVDSIAVDSSTGDTTGFAVVPIFLWVTMQAKSTAGTDTLFYFSKTDVMPQRTDTGNIDVGEIVYAPISVGTNSVTPKATFTRQNQVLVQSVPRKNKAIFNLNTLQSRPVSLEIFNIAGMRIADLTGSLNHGPSSITWEAKKSGTYILRCKTGGGMVSQAFSIM